jgi:hypothetical protein
VCVCVRARASAYGIVNNVVGKKAGACGREEDLFYGAGAPDRKATSSIEEELSEHRT